MTSGDPFTFNGLLVRYAVHKLSSTLARTLTNLRYSCGSKMSSTVLGKTFSTEGTRAALSQNNSLAVTASTKPKHSFSGLPVEIQARIYRCYFVKLLLRSLTELKRCTDSANNRLRYSSFLTKMAKQESNTTWQHQIILVLSTLFGDQLQ